VIQLESIGKMSHNCVVSTVNLAR